MKTDPVWLLAACVIGFTAGVALEKRVVQRASTHVVGQPCEACGLECRPTNSTVVHLGCWQHLQTQAQRRHALVASPK